MEFGDRIVKQKREIWVDEVKLIACILVVMGHFYQSIVKAEIVNESVFYDWFIDTIYCFHVPLFFICSGYLFQKYSKVNSITELLRNICNKALVLGVPYFVFSFVTWLLKVCFASSVNNQIGSLLYIWFVQPTAPYWFLFILFLIFVVSFTINSKAHAYVLLGIALGLKILNGLHVYVGISVIDKVFEFWVWFVFGMMLAYGVIRIGNRLVGYVSLGLFVVAIILFVVKHIRIPFSGTIVGFFACFAIISLVFNYAGEDYRSKCIAFLTQYTMPIFLMHTIFAAPVRILMVKMGITYVLLQCAIGVIISFAGPVLAMKFMEYYKPLDFLVYPGRYIKFKKR